MPPKPRLSLVERQQLLLEERGFSKATKPPTSAAGAAAVLSGAAPSSSSKATAGDLRKRGSGASASTSASTTASSPELAPSPHQSFMERQEKLLIKTGRGNAARASRVAVPMEAGADNDGDEVGDAGSMASRASKAPSIHPSLAGTTFSLACSEATIGAGDDTGYWDFQHRKCTKGDLSHRCRECRQPFTTIGEPITERRGARISARYHAECFSGFADPRSQCRSSHHEGHLAGSQMDAAPSDKAGSKMRTNCHFEGGRIASGLGGKWGGAMGMGHNNFGTKSSKHQGVAPPQRAPGGFTEEELAAFNRQQEHSNSLSLPCIEERAASEAGLGEGPPPTPPVVGK